MPPSFLANRPLDERSADGSIRKTNKIPTKFLLSDFKEQ